MSTNTEQTMYLPELGTIERVETMTATEKYFRVKLNSGKDIGHEPGQFASFTMMGIGEAPISISSSSTDKGGFDIVVRKIGNVTGAMHNLRVGDTVGVRGPFGTHFPYEETKGRDLLFVTGGIGLVPARSFINYVLDNRADYGKVTILFGARTPSDRLFVNELEEWKKRDDVEFLETVDKGDDSWTGNVGVITTLFPKINIDAAKTTCVVVGPPIMYKFVIIEAKKAGISDENIYVDLERRMKCGVGKCGHCQINELYCCQDGSVFKYSDLASVPEAL